MKDVLLLVGAGQIGMAIARRIGFDKKIIKHLSSKNLLSLFITNFFYTS